MRPYLSIIRALFLGVLVSTVVGDSAGCKKPKVRREWRKLSPSERTEWLKAVSVRIPLLQIVYDAN